MVITTGIKAKTVFYADDDAEDRELFHDVISEINNPVNCHLYETGDELLSTLKNPPPTPNYIFLDLNMPGKNGFDILEEIRFKKDFSKLPVIILSTSNDFETINRCKKLGADFYINKPTDYRILKESILYALNIDWQSRKFSSDNFVYAPN